MLNVDTRAPASDAYIRISGGFDLLRQLFCHVSNDWSLQVHTNGHNPKSWLIALACGVAGQFGPGATLTLHSGLVPEYLNAGPAWRQFVARVTCCLYERVVCVNEEIANAIASIRIPRERLETVPAYLPVAASDAALPGAIEQWRRQHSPVLTATMFFRPEYGFELLIKAVSELRKKYPKVGCIVMGSGEERDAAETLLAQKGLTDTVLLAGDLDHELCLALMARSAAFVRPTFCDGDSISVREAAALGVPVVASNVGTRPEGTLLFEAGDMDGLVGAVDMVLSGAPGGREHEVVCCNG